jgi:hypothetical protein
MRAARFAVVAALLGALATAGAALAVWPDSLPQPNLYRVVGYLDQAAPNVKVRDRITIYARGHRDRELLVAQYGTPGETSIDLELSRALGRRYAVAGSPEDVERLFALPAGREFSALFVAYQDGPRLLIGELE